MYEETVYNRKQLVRSPFHFPISIASQTRYVSHKEKKETERNTVHTQPGFQQEISAAGGKTLTWFMSNYNTQTLQNT